MMLQVDLGAEKRKEQLAPLRRTAAVRETRSRLAEVQQGERQVRADCRASQASLKGEDPSRAAAKCLRELHSVAIAPSLKHAPATNQQVYISYATRL